MIIATIGVGAAGTNGAAESILASATGVAFDYRWCFATGGRLVAISISWITAEHNPFVYIAPPIRA